MKEKVKKSKRNRRKSQNKKVKHLGTVRVLGEEGIFEVKRFQSYFAKLKGLEFVEPDDYTYYFVDCRSIHTYGMRHKLDVAFVTLDGFVVEVFRNVGPDRIIKNSSAFGVFERFASDEPWFVKDEQILMDVDTLVEMGWLTDEELSRL